MATKEYRLLSRIYTYKGIQYALSDGKTTISKYVGNTRKETQKNVYAVCINGKWSLTPKTTISGVKFFINNYIL